jgi:hypothetical protein
MGNTASKGLRILLLGAAENVNDLIYEAYKQTSKSALHY